MEGLGLGLIRETLEEELLDEWEQDPAFGGNDGPGLRNGSDLRGEWSQPVRIVEREIWLEKGYMHRLILNIVEVIFL